MPLSCALPVSFSKYIRDAEPYQTLRGEMGGVSDQEDGELVSLLFGVKHRCSSHQYRDFV